MNQPNTEYENIEYRTNFLKEVIARIDFVSPVSKLEKELPPTVSKAALSSFPISEPRKAIAQELQVSPKELHTKTTESMEWRFHGKEKEKTLTVTPHSLFVKYKSYSTFEVLRDEFLKITAEFFNAFPDVQCSRLGLRYINNITPPNGNIFEWGDYINESMLSIFQFYPEATHLSRVFNILEFNFEEFQLRYQFGMPNPDYPARIRKKVFVLDLDAYYQGLQNENEVSANLQNFHGKIQELFEHSITDNLREIMNA